MEGQVEIQADQYIPFPMEEVSFDYEIVGPNENDPELMDVLLVATRTENVDQRQTGCTGSRSDRTRSSMSRHLPSRMPAHS